jgi:type I restriction enzyme S subunit
MTPEIKQRIDKICHGEVPEGYQRTFLGIAPKSWDKSRIDKICRLSSGSTPRRDAVENFAGDILWVTSGELKRRTIEDTREKISETAVVNSHLEIYDPGTVVIAIYGLEAAGIRGTVSIIGKQCTISQACMAFTEFKGIDNEFFYYWYLNNGQVIGLRYAQGTKQQNLSTDIVGSFPICFPSQGEQQKIAAILTTQDRVIELKEKRLAGKQRQKKYLMQQLLTGKKRLPGFSGAWKNIKLCEVLSERKEKNIEQNLRICSVAVQKGVIDQIEHLGRSYAASDTSNYSVAHYGDIIYTKSPTGDFLYGIVKQNLLQETVAVSPLYGVFTPMTFGLGYFLHTYFQSAICAQNYLLPIVQKGAKNTINITNDTFISSKLYLPLDVEEQKAIADTFIAADREIDLLRQDIEQEKQKKKALMQLLLTGIVRV